MIDDVLRPAVIQASGVVQEGLCVCRDVQGRKEVPCRGASSCTSSAMAASARQGNHDARRRRARARGERREARLAAGCSPKVQIGDEAGRSTMVACR